MADRTARRTAGPSVPGRPAAGRARPPALGRHRTLRAGRLTVRVLPRAATVAAGALLALTALGLLQLCTGTYAVTPARLLATLARTDHADDFLVLTLGLPRLAAAALAGAALGMSGAVFQTLTRNPLGSPDIAGFGAGAATGAVVQMLVLHDTSVPLVAGATAGGLLAAGLVHTLSGGTGHGTTRLVLTGMAVSAALAAINSYLLVRAEVDDVQTAAVWLAGSLDNVGRQQVALMAAALAVLVPAVLAHARPLRLLEMGDDLATALGSDPARTRARLLLLGVLLVAVATSACGPVPFVALAAPQVARRLTRRGHAGPIESALTGAVLLTASDTAVQQWLPGQLPAGIVTGAVGGCYLVTLLARRARR